MNKLAIALLALGLAAGAAGAAKPRPLSGEQDRIIQCVAILSIIASEQGRGVEDALAYPPLAETGARFAQVAGERLMTETGRTKEQVRDAFIAGVAAQQASAQSGGERKALARAGVMDCIALMNTVAPPPPPPTLPQCAAMVKLAYEEVEAREGLSKAAKDLATIASVLDARAREEMRAAGKTESAIGAEMSKTGTEIAAEAARREADEVSAGLDFESCFDMATE